MRQAGVITKNEATDLKAPSRFTWGDFAEMVNVRFRFPHTFIYHLDSDIKLDAVRVSITLWG